MSKENNDVEEENEQLWEKIRAIRGNWRKPDKLKALLAEWEEIGPGFGPEYNERASKLVGHHTRMAWASIATEERDNSIEDLLRTLWESFRQAGGEFTVEKTEAGGVQIHATKCPMADVYKSIGKESYGFLFHCVTDPHIVAGFNPEIDFRRTKTLMEGHAECDHYYEMK
ncbi:MAG: L-2-amino-thiazoline-4-carboxylic acid hydrolase [Candidatus Hodarchaeales archaeon]|jgi:predicted ArsR family transcriptional regulator